MPSKLLISEFKQQTAGDNKAFRDVSFILKPTDITNTTREATI